MPRNTSPDSSSSGFQGCLHFDAMQKFLRKEISFQQLLRRGKSAESNIPTQSRLGALMTFVLKSDAAYEAMKKETRFANMLGRSVFFAVAPLTSPWAPALRWSLDWKKHESFTPVLLPIEAVDDVFSTSLPAWLEVLVRLQETPSRQLVECFGIANETARVGIEDEIRNRLAQFGKFEHAFFFQDPRIILAWDIAAKQIASDTGKVPMWERREQINKRWQFNLSEPEFKSFTPEEVLASLPHKTKKPLAALQRVNVRIHEEFSSRPIRRQFSGRDKSGIEVFAEPPPFPFSRGGYFNEFLFRSEPARWHQFPAHGELKTEEQLQEALWWWRNISSWPEELRDEFPDNWESSAFFYEFRARILPQHTWDLFDTPWFDLDVSQRAVLFYLCPPSKFGKHFREGRISTDTKWEHDFRSSEATVFVNPAQPIAKAIAHLKKEFRYQKEILLGVSEGPKARKNAARKSWRWELIEALDGQHFLEHKLIHKDFKRLARAKKEYEAACAAAGLSPYESVRSRNC